MKKPVHILITVLLVTALGGVGPAALASSGPADPAPEATVPTVVQKAREFSTDATESVIKTGITYNGQEIEFFGSTDGIRADALVVKLTSPAETVKINVKGRFGPFWMNTRQYEVDNVPLIYKIRASAKLQDILTPELAQELGLGFDVIKDQLKLHILKGTEEPDDLDTVFKGLVQLKEDEDLYSIDESGTLQLKGDKGFRHSFRFPPGAKPGTYNVDSYLLRNKKLVGYSRDTIEIEKVGLVAFIFKASKEQPVLYGICSVIIALAAGLLVGFIFKGGGHH